MIRPYLPADLPAVTELVCRETTFSPAEVADKLQDAEAYVCTSADNEILGIVSVKPKDSKQAWVDLLTATPHRRKGIGSRLFAQARKTQAAGQAESFFTNYNRNDPDTVSFFRKRGLKKWFGVEFMQYAGGPFPEPPLSVRMYEDEDFDAYLQALSDAFYELRRANNIKPYAVTEENRDEAKKHFRKLGDRIYLFLTPDGSLLGSALIRPDGVLDNLFVDPAYGGQGYGKKITHYMINRCLEQGISPVTLDVIDTNTRAIRLYESVGFTTVLSTESALGPIDSATKNPDAK